MKLLIVAMLLLSGCGHPPEPNQEIRESLFFKCLAALPVGPAQVKNNDWDEVVAECGHQAYLLSFDRRPVQP